jgi:hypothetical protein
MDGRAKVEKDIIMIWRVTLLYLFLASIWIIFSDIVLEWFAPDITLYARLQTYKGWVFVLVTGSLLYLYLKPRTDSLRRSQKDLFEAKEELRESEKKIQGIESVKPVHFRLFGCAYLCAGRDRINNKNKQVMESFCSC